MSGSPCERDHRAGVDARTPQDIVLVFLDVLGFRQIVQERPLDQLNEEYRELLKLKRHAGVVPVLSIQGVDRWRSPSAVFSDTIVFWADATPEGADSLLTTCSVLIAEALQRGWPLRGAIAAGECVLDREERVFVGRPIVDAYLLEGAQEWVGASLHPSCLQHSRVGELMAANDNVRKYDVPMKGAYSHRIDHAVEWGSRILDWQEKLTALKNKAPASEACKYDNSLQFVKATRVN